MSKLFVSAFVILGSDFQQDIVRVVEVDGATFFVTMNIEHVLSRLKIGDHPFILFRCRLQGHVMHRADSAYNRCVSMFWEIEKGHGIAAAHVEKDMR